MTLYDLTQAIIRYKVFVILGVTVIFLFVLGMSFTLEDGGIVARGQEKYESSLQISVVAPGTEDLSTQQPSDALPAAASEYADLLSSGEAADVIGQMSGYKLSEPLIATTGGGQVAVITATVIGPTAALAKAAALNAFEWLAITIEKPLQLQPPVEPELLPSPQVELRGPFSSEIILEIDAGLASTQQDLLVLVDTGRGLPIAMPVAANAGDVITSAATLEPTTFIQLYLETTDGSRLDLLRVIPDLLPATAPAFPALAITLASGAIRPVGTEEEATWLLDSSKISTNWIPGTPIVDEAPVQTQQFQIARLTDEPSAFQSGGRRGPLLGFAVLLVGLIGVLSIVIMADTWHRQREIREATDVKLPTGGRAVTGRVEATDMSVDVQLTTETVEEPSDAIAASDSIPVDQ